MPCPVTYDDCIVRGTTITIRWITSISGACGVPTKAYLQVKNPKSNNYETIQTLSGNATSASFDYTQWVSSTKYVYARIVLENEKGTFTNLSKVYDVKNTKWLF